MLYIAAPKLSVRLDASSLNSYCSGRIPNKIFDTNSQYKCPLRVIITLSTKNESPRVLNAVCAFPDLLLRLSISRNESL